MGRVKSLRVRNYRSIKAGVEIAFPHQTPIVLVGENNAGKSNIVRGLDLLFGETWPGSFSPEEHDFFDRDPANEPIQISVRVDGISHRDKYGERPVAEFLLEHPDQGGDGRQFRMTHTDGTPNPYVSNETRGQCICMLVSADRRLSYQLSYTSKWTFLSKLMRKFHQSLTADVGRVRQLKAQFDELVRIFRQVPEFKEFAKTLKSQVDDLSANLQYGLDMDFSAYDPSNYFRSLRVQPSEEGATRTFDELGTGQEQLLALAFAYAYAKAFHDAASDLLLVVEEPEAHLHPLAQDWVAQRIRAIAAEGVQVVVTTHSPNFIDLSDLEGLVLVRKQGPETRTTQLTREKLAEFCRETGATKAQPDSILDHYAAAATGDILAGFFARKLVLVEGPTEALALPIYFSRLGLKVAKEGIAVLPVHGVSNLAKWWRLFSAYNLPVYVLFDNDASDDEDGGKRRDVLSAIGVPWDAQEKLIRTDEWVIDERFGIFGSSFEEVLRSGLGEQHDELSRDARRYGLGPTAGKPLVARFIAERIDLDDERQGVQKLRTLIEAIENIE